MLYILAIAKRMVFSTVWVPSPASGRLRRVGPMPSPAPSTRLARRSTASLSPRPTAFPSAVFKTNYFYILIFLKTMKNLKAIFIEA